VHLIMHNFIITQILGCILDVYANTIQSFPGYLLIISRNRDMYVYNSHFHNLRGISTLSWQLRQLQGDFRLINTNASHPVWTCKASESFLIVPSIYKINKPIKDIHTNIWLLRKCKEHMKVRKHLLQFFYYNISLFNSKSFIFLSYPRTIKKTLFFYVILYNYILYNYILWFWFYNIII